jgi:hypothetical protein
MAKIRSETELFSEIDREFSWRILEIATVKKEISTASAISRRALLRAGVPIVYAHWEGGVKNLSAMYADFLLSRRLRFSQVNDCLFGLAALNRVRTISDIKRKIFVASSELKSLMDIQNERLELPIRSYVWNIGNLNYEMFEQLVLFFGFDPNPYTPRSQFIDQKLVKRRNEIAHGEHLLVDEEEFSEISEGAIMLMTSFKIDIENSVIGKLYLRQSLTGEDAAVRD